jgi:diaminopimelate epimerase
MQTAFLKMHGAGNRILIVDQRRDNRQPPTSEELRRLGDSDTGPGFDQLMWVGPPNDPAMAASYRVFNADGSEVEQCGNGVRCVAWMLAQDDAEPHTYMLESPTGLIQACVQSDNTVAVSMGPPEFDPARIPFVADSQSDIYALDANNQALSVSVLSMGNPHCVLEVADTAIADVAGLGPVIEHHRRFPQCANVGFMRIRDRNNIDLRVHERGVGETLACGTGACAAVVSGQRRNLLDEKVNVSQPGGQLVVSWRGGAEPVWLTGDTELISEGLVDI